MLCSGHALHCSDDCFDAKLEPGHRPATVFAGNRHLPKLGQFVPLSAPEPQGLRSIRRRPSTSASTIAEDDTSSSTGIPQGEKQRLVYRAFADPQSSPPPSIGTTAGTRTVAARYSRIYRRSRSSGRSGGVERRPEVDVGVVFRAHAM